MNVFKPVDPAFYLVYFRIRKLRFILGNISKQLPDDGTSEKNKQAYKRDSQHFFNLYH